MMGNTGAVAKPYSSSSSSSFNPCKKEPTLLEIPSLLLLKDSPDRASASSTTTTTPNHAGGGEDIDWTSVIPEETMLKVFKELSVSDTLGICLASRRWGELWQDKHLWKHFHLRDLGGKPQPPLLRNAWRRSFVDIVNTLRGFKTEEGRFFFAVRSGLVNLVDRMLKRRPGLLYKKRTDKVWYPGYWQADQEKNCPLAHAAFHGSLAMFQYLWDTHYNAPTPTTTTATTRRTTSTTDTEALLIQCLDWAVTLGHEELYNSMLANPAMVSLGKLKTYRPSEDVLSRCCKEGRLGILKSLIENGTTLTMVAVQDALEGNHKELVLHLLDLYPTGVIGTSYGRWNWSRTLSTVGMAVNRSDRVVVKKMLSLDSSALLYMPARGVVSWASVIETYLAKTERTKPWDKKILKWLITKRNSENIGDSPYHSKDLAFYSKDISEGDLKLLQFLIKIGETTVNAIDPATGDTLLHSAIKKGAEPMVEILLQCGADATMKGKRGQPTPLSMAKQVGEPSIASMIADHLNPSSKKKKGTKRKREEKEKETNEDEGKEKGKEKEKEKEKEEKENPPAEKRSRRRRRSNSDKKEKESKPARSRGGRAKPAANEEEAAMECRIKEFLYSLEKNSPYHKDKLACIEGWRGEGVPFTGATLRELCKEFQVKPLPSRKADMMQKLVTILEEKEAIVLNEI